MKTVASPDVTVEQAVEQIDIGKLEKTYLKTDGGIIISYLFIFGLFTFFNFYFLLFFIYYFLERERQVWGLEGRERILNMLHACGA